MTRFAAIALLLCACSSGENNPNYVGIEGLPICGTDQILKQPLVVGIRGGNTHFVDIWDGSSLGGNTKYFQYSGAGEYEFGVGPCDRGLPGTPGPVCRNIQWTYRMKTRLEFTNKAEHANRKMAKKVQVATNELNLPKAAYECQRNPNIVMPEKN